MALERNTRKRTLPLDESITSRFKSAIYNIIIPPTISKWFKGMTSSNTNGTVPMADTSDSSSDDEVIDSIYFEPANKRQRLNPCSEPSAIQTETNNLQGVNVINKDQTSKGEFASTSNASKSKCLKVSSKEENVWMKPVSVQKDDSKIQANEYNLKYNPHLRYAPSYGNCKIGIRGVTRNTRNMIEAEKRKIEAPLTVYKYNNAATYSSDVIKDLLENISPRVAEATSKEVQKSLGNPNKTKQLYIADNARINLKCKSSQEGTDIPINRPKQDRLHNLMGDTTVEGINQSMDLTRSKQQMNNLEANKDSVILQIDELQAKGIAPLDEEVLFAFSKPATAVFPTYGNTLSLNPSIEKSDVPSSILEIKKNLENSECWASNESQVEQCICSRNKISSTIAAQANIPPAKETEVKVNKVKEKSSPASDAYKKIMETQSEKWECTSCLTRNDNSKNKCACCEAEKITKTVPDAYKKIMETQSEKWECTSCLTRNDSSKNKCACCEAEKITKTVPDAYKKIMETQNEKWECTGCLTRNDNSKNKCACCEAEKITKTVPDAYKKIMETQNEKWECTGCLTRNDSSKNKCVCCEAEKSNEKNKINSKQLNFRNVPNPTFKFGIDPKEQNDKQDSLPQTKSLINTEMSGETSNNVLPKVPSFKFGIPPKIDETQAKNIETPKINFTFGVFNQKETNSALTILANNKENKDNENPQEVPKVDLTLNVSNAVPVAAQAQIQNPAFASSMQKVVTQEPVAVTTTESIQKISTHTFVPTTIASSSVNETALSTSNIFRNYKPKTSPSKSILQQPNVDQNSGIKKTPNMFNFSANTNNVGQAANPSFNFGLPVTNISANVQTNNNPVMFDIPAQRENAWPPAHPFDSNIQQFKITEFNEPTRFHAPMSPQLNDYGQLNKTESAAPMGNIFNTNNFVPQQQQQPFGMQCQQVRPKFNFGARRSNENVFGFGENDSNIRQPAQDNGMWGNLNQGQVVPANSLQFNMGTGTANNPPPRRFKRALRRTQQR